MLTETNVQSVVITNAVGLVLLVCLFLSSNMTRQRRNLDDRIFVALMAVCAGACACEMLTWLVDGRPEPWARALNYLGCEYCYVVTALYGYLWVLYVDARLHKNAQRIVRWYPALLVPTLIIMAADLGSLVGNYMFVISDDNVYRRLPLSFLNYGMSLVSLSYSVWMRRALRKKHGLERFFPLWMFLVPVIVGSAIQALVFGISLAWLGIAIGLVSVHMSLQNELSYLDPLTGLYNRTYLNYALQRMNHRSASSCGIMIDLDYFKQINDVHGHSAGDRALQQVADILVLCVGDEGTIIRFAGDEFIVIMNTGSEAVAARIGKSIRDTVDEFNATGAAPYTLSLSLGYGTFNPADNDTPDAFLHRIDERMYQEKRDKHAQRD